MTSRGFDGGAGGVNREGFGLRVECDGPAFRLHLLPPHLSLRGAGGTICPHLLSLKDCRARKGRQIAIIKCADEPGFKCAACRFFRQSCAPKCDLVGEE